VRIDAAAELMGHRLQAVADAEHRQARGEDLIRRAGRAFVRHRGRSAGKDHTLGLQALERLRRRLERRDLAVDADLADAPRDQLRHLAAEIDDQDGIGRVGVCFGFRHGQPIVIAAAAVQLRR